MMEDVLLCRWINKQVGDTRTRSIHDLECHCNKAMYSISSFLFHHYPPTSIDL